jgi:sorbitol/mannitol transport system permease protein
MTATVEEERSAPPANVGGAAMIDRAEGWRRRGPLLPALIFTIIVTQIPFILTLYYSLQSWNLVRPGSQEFVWFSNYGDVFADSQFRTVALNTVIMTLGSVLIAVVLGLLLTPFLITPVAAALLWKTVLLDPTLGLINFVLTPFGGAGTEWISQYPLASVMAALIWQWTPFMMLLLLAGLQSMPTDQLEAARVDGASAWSTFRELTLPHLRRFIELGVVLGTIYLVNIFDQVYMMTQGGPGVASANLPFYIYQRAFLGFDIGQSAAMGVVVVILTLIAANFALRLIFKSFSGTEEAA